MQCTYFGSCLCQRFEINASCLRKSLTVCESVFDSLGDVDMSEIL